MDTVAYNKTDDVASLIASVGHWHQRFEIVPGVMTPGSYNAPALFDLLKLPSDLSGKRVLDMGSNDGYFAATCARRGADVVAYDYVPKTASGFLVTEKLFDVSIRHIHDNIWNVGSYELGKFDIVLFLGVLYHLPDPFRGLTLMADLCGGTLYLETVCWTLETDAPVMVFTPGSSLNNDITNFWVPNQPCLRAMLEDIGFSVESMQGGPERQLVVAQRAADRADGRRLRLAYGKR